MYIEKALGIILNPHLLSNLFFDATIKCNRTTSHVHEKWTFDNLIDTQFFHFY